MQARQGKVGSVSEISSMIAKKFIDDTQLLLVAKKLRLYSKMLKPIITGIMGDVQIRFEVGKHLPPSTITVSY